MRADKFFAEHFGSRTKAAEAIERGEILVVGKPIHASDEISDDVAFSILQPKERFVSNGGYKLSQALKFLSVSVTSKTFVDFGASTGGFTDCLLQNGAKKVYAVDVGESLLDQSLRNDARIVQMQNRNVRYLSLEDFPEPIDGVVIDVSFISLKNVLGAAKNVLTENGIVLALIKPQFECGKNAIGKSGIVKNPKIRELVIKDIYLFACNLGLYPQGIVNAPIKEKKNIEYMIWLQNGAKKYATLEQIWIMANEIK